MARISLLKESIERWNQWRWEHPNKPCSLEGQDLSRGYFFEGDFSGANLRGAKLSGACLIGADLRWADLTGADLRGAYLGEANLYGASLADANFTGANLERANLNRARGVSSQLVKAYNAQQLAQSPA
ncbi:MAG: pentapeptide repeat-containing protein [Cyanobacteria bacterium J06597_16]